LGEGDRRAGLIAGVHTEKVTGKINTPSYAQVPLRSGDNRQVSPSIRVC